MIDNLFRFFQDLVGESSAEVVHDDNAILLGAVCLMLEVARSDTSKQQVEFETIEAVLGQHFDVDSQQIKGLIVAASEKVETAHDLYQFTHLINESFDYSEKEKLIHAMWLVAFADEHIESSEDHIIRRIAGLIHLPHTDFIRLKLRARDGKGSSD